MIIFEDKLTFSLIYFWVP